MPGLSQSGEIAEQENPVQTFNLKKGVEAPTENLDVKIGNEITKRTQEIIIKVIGIIGVAIVGVCYWSLMGNEWQNINGYW
jgi:hypothetical protein